MPSFSWWWLILHDFANFVFQADCLDDLAFAIMHEMSKLSYRVTEEDVIRARNQVIFEVMWEHYHTLCISVYSDTACCKAWLFSFFWAQETNHIIMIIFSLVCWHMWFIHRKFSASIHMFIAWWWQFQLKSSLQLHLDGSTAVVEDIGRQVLSCSFVLMSKNNYVMPNLSAQHPCNLLSFPCCASCWPMADEFLLLSFLQE